MRLIDADAFERAVMFSDDEDLQDVIYRLRDYPTIDAVSVVRCKECKYDGTWKCKWRNIMIPSFPSADDFCSYGEHLE